MKTIFTIIGLFLAVLVNGQTNFFWSYNATITPVVTTQAVTNIGATTATGNGTVIQRGNPPITERGSCWNTSTNPTVSNSRTSDGTGVGAFTSAMYPFTYGVTYYVRAYVINATGNYYGDNVTFTPAGVPTVTTDNASNIASTSFTDGGNVTSDGGGTVSERGIVYGYSTAPTTSSYKKIIGSGTGTFSSSISNQIYGDWKYYVRAYAINGEGTAYGNEVTAITPCNAVPQVAGISFISKVGTTVTIDVLGVNSASCTAVGVCYMVSGTPSISDAHTEVSITPPLAPNSTVRVVVTGITGAMYWRSYATSSCGTGYNSATPFYY